MIKNFLCWVLCVVFIGLVLAGCTSTKDAQEEASQEATADMKQQLTLEYVISHSELTEADFESVDFDEFVAMYELTQENIEEYYLPDLIAMYHRKMALENTTEYSSIYTNANGQITEQDYGRIDVLIMEYHEGSDNHYLIIDLTQGKVFKSRTDIISSCGESNKVVDMEADDKQFVLDALRNSGIADWKNEYIGTNEETTGSLSWSVGIRMSDGDCVSYHGNGVQNSGTPTELFALKDSLLKYFAR